MTFTILTKEGCKHCVEAKQALKMKGLEYEEILHTEPEDFDNFLTKGYRTFPQVFHKESHIGGRTELEIYLIENF